ncbi:hypothetical protein ABJ384_05010 [Acinetobacter sp. A1-4-2]|jgi:hypothetical protein|uniref:Ribbon-helix-helix, copG family protein n=1 Tax=Acinetobacter sp. A1-4-2 TaxID=3156489 RepID=A0AAU7SZN5_9GAMM
MSTSNSPFNTTRSIKLDGGRVRCVVYLPKEEADHINTLAKKSQQSQSSVIAKFYFQGKNQTETNED